MDGGICFSKEWDDRAYLQVSCFLCNKSSMLLCSQFMITFVYSHCDRFPCGRWLGRGIDDGSTERLLIGELLPNSDPRSEIAETCSTPPRCRSPSLPKENRKDNKLSIPEIQHMLGERLLFIYWNTTLFSFCLRLILNLFCCFSSRWLCKQHC